MNNHSSANSNLNNELGALFNQQSNKKKQELLFVINAHSSDTVKTVEIDERVRLLHYCAPNCTLKTISHIRGERITRRVSVELACLGHLMVHEIQEGVCSDYRFYTSREDERHGLFFCNGHELVRIHKLNPGLKYTLTNIVNLILEYTKARDLTFDTINLGVMACRSNCKDAPKMYALSEGCNRDNPRHPCFTMRNNTNWFKPRYTNRSRRNRSRNRRQSTNQTSSPTRSRNRSRNHKK